MDKLNSLQPVIITIVKNKGTEHPFSGQYTNFTKAGTYLCRQCGLALFRAQTKFHSGCGWPSFDNDIPGYVKRVPDPDGQRTEILCMRCKAHLGHVFEGEGFTLQNTRHCVNSASLDFVANITVLDTEEIILAAGCFWGVEYYLKRLSGVLKTEVGFIGGHLDNPSYRDICSHSTGHIEAVRVVFDPSEITLLALLKYFFEIHDPMQVNGQGPDIGSQYSSVIFYYNEEQKIIAENVMAMLQQKGLSLATKLMQVTVFWPAEDYHQDYYAKTHKEPYCHFYIKRF